MKKIVVAFALTTCWPALMLKAQQNDSLNNIYGSVEIGGNGIIPSFSVEKLLGKSRPFFVGRIGAAAWPFIVKGFSDSRLIGPSVEFSFLHGKQRNHFETGLGYSALFAFGAENKLDNIDVHFLMARIGYRHYSKSYRSYFKIAYTPVFLTTPDNFNSRFDPRFVPLFFGVAYGFKL